MKISTAISSFLFILPLIIYLVPDMQILVLVYLLSLLAFLLISYKFSNERIYLLTLLILLILFTALLYISNSHDYYISSYNSDVYLYKDKIHVIENLDYKFSSTKHELFRYFKLPTNGPKSISNIKVSCSSGTGSVTGTDSIIKYPEALCDGEYDKNARMTIEYDINEPYTNGKMDWVIMDDTDTYIKDINVKVHGNYEKYFVNPPDKILPPHGVLELALNYDSDEPYMSKYRMAKLSSSIIFLLTILMIPFSYWIWNKYGKEKEFSVPDVIHFAPTKRKPYLVNYLFCNTTGSMSEEAFLSILVDMALKGYVKIHKDSIEFLKTPKGLDYYEEKVYNTFKKYSRNGIFKPSYVKNPVYIDRLTTPTYKMKEILKSYLDTRGVRILIISLLSLMSLTFLSYILFAMNIYVLFTSDRTLYMFSLGAQIILLTAVYANKRIFGKFKPEIQKEFLMWNAFKKMLSDESLIKKYSTRDLNMWKEWLVYATAFGCAKKVLKEMKELNIKIDNINPDAVYFLAFTMSSNGKYGGMSTGGSFSGGFGGGGAGAR